jgi:hypothetical protein
VKTGVNFDLDYVPSASIEGFIAMPPGGRAQLLLSSGVDSPYQTTTSATIGADGQFAFRRLSPGHYVITAQAFTTPAAGTRSADLTLWGRTDVVVSGDDIAGVNLILQPALTLTGDLVFEGTASPPTLNGFKWPLQFLASRGTHSAPFPIAVIEGSQVVLRGLVPGTYRFMSSPQGIRTRVGPWWLKSILIDDRELLDRPLEIPPNPKSMRVTFSDQASQLSGAVTDRDGTPVSHSYVVVFSDDPRTWFLNSRRVAAVQLKADGRYTVSNLPAGNYFIAVSSDLENNEWFDPERLEVLRASAMRVSIGENQSVSRNITVGQRQP